MAPVSTDTNLNKKVVEGVEALKAGVQGQTAAPPAPKTYMGVDGKEHVLPEIMQEDVDHWHKHGYVIVKNFLHPDELAAALHGFHQHMPDWEEYKARAPLFQELKGPSTRVGTGWVRYDFPFDNDVLNKMQSHPFLLAFAERIHGHSNFKLSHSAIVGKYAGKADYDQQLHSDYSNNTLVIPLRGTDNIDLPMIIYYTDVTLDLGPTFVVSKTHGTDDLIAVGKRHFSRAEYPELYKFEKPAVCPAGSVLIYNMRTFHRGSRMLATEGLRYNQFIAFHKPQPWLASATFTGLGDLPAMKRFITNATPRERELIGFPAVGDPYWDSEEVRRGVANRYPDMDMTPYGGRP